MRTDQQSARRLFNAIDTLKKHGDKPVVRANSLSLIERGLLGFATWSKRRYDLPVWRQRPSFNGAGF